MDTIGIEITKNYVDLHIEGLFDVYVTMEGIVTAVFAVVAYTVYKKIKSDRLSKRVEQAFAELGIEKPDNLIDFDDWDK